MRRELRRLLDEMTDQTGRVAQRDLIAAFRKLELTDGLKDELLEEAIKALLHEVVETDTVARLRARQRRRQAQAPV